MLSLHQVEQGGKEKTKLLSNLARPPGLLLVARGWALSVDHCPLESGRDIASVGGQLESHLVGGEGALKARGAW